MPSTLLNAVQIAELAVLSGDATIIVLDLQNGGGSSRWGQQFPSLTTEQLNALDEVAFLSFDSQKEAFDLFQTITGEGGDIEMGGIISGSITLVTRPWGEDDGVETIIWDFDDDTCPVFDGRKWSSRTGLVHL